MERYNNKQDLADQDKIPEGYFNFLKNPTKHRGHFIELLAKYGDKSEFEVPQGLRTETNADMSFTGVQTSFTSRFYIRPTERGIPFFERELTTFNFE